MELSLREYHLEYDHMKNLGYFKECGEIPIS